MAWIEYSVPNLNNIKVHFTPLANLQSIMENGILLPGAARITGSHISPYDAWATSRNHSGTISKDAVTFFGVIGTLTFVQWTQDESFIDNNVGFVLRGDSHFIENYDIAGYKRYRVNHDISPIEIKYKISLVSKLPVLKGNFDRVVIFDEGVYKVFKWED